MRRAGLVVSLAVVFFVGSAFGQSAPDYEQGMKAYGSYHGGNIDTVSLSNQNLFVHADVFSYSQRGGELVYPVVLEYNNKNYGIFGTPCAGYPTSFDLGQVKPGSPICYLKQTVVFGPGPFGLLNAASEGATVTLAYEGLPDTGSARVDTTLSFDGNKIYVWPNSVLTPDGSAHQLAPSDSNGGSVTIDGSGFAVTSQGIIDRHGTLFNGSVAKDRNGNQFTLSSTAWTDTLGRQFPLPPLTSLTATPPPSTASLDSCPILGYSFQSVIAAYTMSLPTVGGGTVPLILCYTNVYVRTGPGGPNFYDVNRGFSMLQSVVLPDHNYWAFNYDAADPNNSTSYSHGDLLKITLPTGGTISYVWAQWTSGCSALNSRGVVSRTVDANDGTGPQKWTYSNGVVTDPLGNDTVHAFTGLDGTCSLFETQTQHFQGSHTGGTLLKTVTTDYQRTVNPYDAAVLSGGAQSSANSVINVFATRVTTTLPNGLVSAVETDYDTALSYHGGLDGITSNVKECPTTDPGGNDNLDCHYYFYGDQTRLPLLMPHLYF